jgi:hypothetical protein
MLSKSQASERKKSFEVDAGKRKIRELESMLNKNIRHKLPKAKNSLSSRNCKLVLISSKQKLLPSNLSAPRLEC